MRHSEHAHDHRSTENPETSKDDLPASSCCHDTSCASNPLPAATVHGHVEHAHEEHVHEAREHHHAGHVHLDDCGSRACAIPQSSLTAVGSSSLLLRIPAMDCPTEEGQIRRALERFPEVAGLRFDLPARALSIDAPPAAWEPVIAAINSAGFKTETLSAPPSTNLSASRLRAPPPPARAATSAFGGAFSKSRSSPKDKRELFSVMEAFLDRHRLQKAS